MDDQYRLEWWRLWCWQPYEIGLYQGHDHCCTGRQTGQCEFENDPIFGMMMPTECPDVPSEILNPRNTWADKKLMMKSKIPGWFCKEF